LADFSVLIAPLAEIRDWQEGIHAMPLGTHRAT